MNPRPDSPKKTFLDHNFWDFLNSTQLMNHEKYDQWKINSFFLTFRHSSNCWFTSWWKFTRPLWYRSSGLYCRPTCNTSSNQIWKYSLGVKICHVWKWTPNCTGRGRGYGLDTHQIRKSLKRLAWYRVSFCIRKPWLRRRETGMFLYKNHCWKLL